MAVPPLMRGAGVVSARLQVFEVVTPPQVPPAVLNDQVERATEETGEGRAARRRRRRRGSGRRGEGERLVATALRRMRALAGSKAAAGAMRATLRCCCTRRTKRERGLARRARMLRSCAPSSGKKCAGVTSILRPSRGGPCGVQEAGGREVGVDGAARRGAGRGGTWGDARAGGEIGGGILPEWAGVSKLFAGLILILPSARVSTSPRAAAPIELRCTRARW
jgi:hypothetical protein